MVHSPFSCIEIFLDVIKMNKQKKFIEESKMYFLRWLAECKYQHSWNKYVNQAGQTKVRVGAQFKVV